MKRLFTFFFIATLLLFSGVVTADEIAEIKVDWQAWSADFGPDMGRYVKLILQPSIIISYTVAITNVTSREQWDRQKRTALKYVAAQAGILEAERNDVAAIRVRLTTWLAGLTALERDTQFKDMIPVFWIAYNEMRTGSAWTEDVDEATIVIPPRAIRISKAQNEGWTGLMAAANKSQYIMDAAQ